MTQVTGSMPPAVAVFILKTVYRKGRQGSQGKAVVRLSKKSPSRPKFLNPFAYHCALCGLASFSGVLLLYFRRALSCRFGGKRSIDFPHHATEIGRRFVALKTAGQFDLGMQLATLVK